MSVYTILMSCHLIMALKVFSASIEIKLSFTTRCGVKAIE